MTELPFRLNVGQNRSAREALDVGLMREALEALQKIDEAMVPTTLGTNDLSNLWRKARATITKLEQRLLRE